MFPGHVNSKYYQDLHAYVHQVSREMHQPLWIESNNQTQARFRYYCTFKKCGCNVEHCFIKNITYNDTTSYTYVREQSILAHTNHPITNEFVEAHRNCYSTETIQEIRHQTDLGVPPGKIRSNCNVICGSDIFYNIRRPVIKEKVDETLERLLDRLDAKENKQVILKKDDNRHTIRDDTIIDLKDIHSRWKRGYVPTEQIQNEIMITNSGCQLVKKNAHNLFAVLGQYTP